MTTTGLVTASATAIPAMLAWQKAHAGQLHYSETANTRLLYETAADLLTPTDCSGNFIRLHRHYVSAAMFKDVTYTGNLIDHGVQITTSKTIARTGAGCVAGDGFLFDFVGAGTPTHIAMYAGNRKIWNHGGPGFDDMGPDLWDLAPNVDAAHHVWVHRYVDPTPVDPLEEIMAFYPSKAAFEAAMKGIVAGEVKSQLLTVTEGHTLVGAAIMGSQDKTTKEAVVVKAGIAAREAAGE